MSRTIAGKIKINSFADIVGGDDSAVTEVPLSDLQFAGINGNSYSSKGISELLDAGF